MNLHIGDLGLENPPVKGDLSQSKLIGIYLLPDLTSSAFIGDFWVLKIDDIRAKCEHRSKA